MALQSLLIPFRKRVWLPRIAYESLPVLYLGIGTFCFLLFEPHINLVFALAFGGAGLLALGLRLRHRFSRPNPRAPSSRDRLIWWPKVFYESLPLIYFLAGILAFLTMDGLGKVIPVIAFFSAGTLATFQRIRYRAHSRISGTAGRQEHLKRDADRSSVSSSRKSPR